MSKNCNLLGNWTWSRAFLTKLEIRNLIISVKPMSYVNLIVIADLLWMKEDAKVEVLKGSLSEGHLFCRQLLKKSFKSVFEKIEWTFFQNYGSQNINSYTIENNVFYN